MKTRKLWVVLLASLCVVAWFTYTPADVRLPWDWTTRLINQLITKPHTWTGTQTFSTAPVFSTTPTTTGISPLSNATSYNLNDVPVFSYQDLVHNAVATEAFVTKFVTYIHTATGNTNEVTLQGGVTGQMKQFVLMTNSLDNYVHIVPVNLKTGTTIELRREGAVASLIYDGNNWNIISNSGTTQ